VSPAARQDPDPIDAIVGQWAAERPDLDGEVMGIVGRHLAVARLVEGEIDARARRHGVDLREGDILFTLRRSGQPFRLTPSAISETLMVASGTLTSRLDRLERKGLIRRVPHPTDRRSTEVELTPEAVRIVDRAIEEHLAHEHAMVEALSERELVQLDRLNRKLLAHLAGRTASG
jgi:DNA-binding MarR family transcriptional regulator